MIFLKSFDLLTANSEEIVIASELRTCFNNYYPLRIFPNKKFERINFTDLNIFYGGNGSGKSTLLNIIAEKTGAERKQNYSKGEFFKQYLERCSTELNNKGLEEIKIITSDDVFDYLLDIRSINNHIDKNRNELFEEYLTYKFNKAGDANDYENLKKAVDAKKKTMSAYVRERLSKNNLIEQSNGESALMYFEKEIKQNSIYILDEPENSLSAESQLKLAKFIEDSIRFYNCQFIISTHSPFILSMKEANIFDLDSTPVSNKKWTELNNVKLYHDFFKIHDNEFKENIEEKTN